MNELRWILIGFGIVLLAAIYLWGRRSNRAVAAGDDAQLRVRPEPTVHTGETTLIRQVDEVAPVTLERKVEPPDERLPEEPEPASGETWRGRLEPTFADAATEELPVHPATSATASAAVAPTLSS